MNESQFSSLRAAAQALQAQKLSLNNNRATDLLGLIAQGQFKQFLSKRDRETKDALFQLINYFQDATNSNERTGNYYLEFIADYFPDIAYRCYTEKKNEGFPIQTFKAIQAKIASLCEQQPIFLSGLIRFHTAKLIENSKLEFASNVEILNDKYKALYLVQYTRDQKKFFNKYLNGFGRASLRILLGPGGILEKILYGITDKKIAEIIENNLISKPYQTPKLNLPLTLDLIPMTPTYAGILAPLSTLASTIDFQHDPSLSGDVHNHVFGEDDIGDSLSSSASWELMSTELTASPFSLPSPHCSPIPLRQADFSGEDSGSLFFSPPKPEQEHVRNNADSSLHFSPPPTQDVKIQMVILANPSQAGNFEGIPMSNNPPSEQRLLEPANSSLSGNKSQGSVGGVWPGSPTKLGFLQGGCKQRVRQNFIDFTNTSNSGNGTSAKRKNDVVNKKRENTPPNNGYIDSTPVALESSIILFSDESALELQFSP